MAFETHLRGQPAYVVLLDPMTRDTPARPARLRRHTSAACPPESCPLGLVSPEATLARPARLCRAPRLHVARGHTSAACSLALCSSAACRPRPHQRGLPPASAACRPRPHQRGLPACVVFLGSMAFETHLRGLPACVVFLGSMAFETHLRGLPACVVFLGSMAFETHLRGLPACVVFLGSMAFETHLRGLPACVVLLGCMSPEATPTRPARLRRAPRLHVARGHTNAACPPASCSSAACRPRPHQRGLPACVVLLGCMSPEATPARPASQTLPKGQTLPACPLQAGSSVEPFPGGNDVPFPRPNPPPRGTTREIPSIRTQNQPRRPRGHDINLFTTTDSSVTNHLPYRIFIGRSSRGNSDQL
ncbi:hypothetical protein C4D60_Mb06t28630 [Musa balbisiana]|uniref:Uncharacterized protein n=1 Tax=Musa balbisiana TaxID=52838 RepID=A0A4S8IRD6_MUSBA|nr:hypothetical protein C4D60_Mb06t28630 [Musa balbisiana]